MLAGCREVAVVVVNLDPALAVDGEFDPDAGSVFVSRLASRCRSRVGRDGRLPPWRVAPEHGFEP